MELVSGQFFENLERRDGRIEYVGVSAEEGAGKTIGAMEFVPHFLAPLDVESILAAVVTHRIVVPAADATV